MIIVLNLLRTKDLLRNYKDTASVTLANAEPKVTFLFHFPVEAL